MFFNQQEVITAALKQEQLFLFFVSRETYLGFEKKRFVSRETYSGFERKDLFHVKQLKAGNFFPATEVLERKNLLYKFQKTMAKLAILFRKRAGNFFPATVNTRHILVIRMMGL